MHARRQTLAGLTLLLAASAAQAGDDITPLITEGTDTVPACATCHGETGLGSADVGAPMIAGMDAGFLAGALRGFAAGTRRGDTMSGIAPELSEAQIDALAAHFAALAPEKQDWPLPETDTPADVARGEAIFRNGAWDAGVPACASCHGQNGEGQSATFPRIAGQEPAYVMTRLEQLAEGDQPSDDSTVALMAAVARKLSPEDRAALAAFVATLDPTAGHVTGYTAANLAWDVPKMKASPLADAIDWTAAQTAYEKQQKRINNPKVYTHTPPTPDQIPEGPEGEMIRFGRDIFINTQQLRGTYVGNDLACTNCHLNAGAKADAAPIWATTVDFPQYRSKNLHVNTLYERLAGCFTYSMNGTPPAPNSKVMVALESYMKWLATGIPSDAIIEPRGYIYLPVPEQKPDYARGEAVYEARCAACHGSDGAGVKNGDHVAFPPLWGETSFNWGAGMHDLEKAAGFIKHNMPLGNADLSDADAWDVALYIDSHQRPQDPRWLGSVEDTRRFFQRGSNTYGLTTPAGKMGDIGAPLPKPAGLSATESVSPKLTDVARAQIAAEGAAN